MLGLEIVVVLGVALLLGGVFARRYPVAPALVLLVFGVLAGFVPALRKAQLPPEVVLLVFLPALLWWESLTTSLREIRSNLRAVVLASTALVVATAGAVAATAHALGMPWGPAWVLGAAVAPTDATAVGVLARGLPRRVTTVLRAESLVNDGTALVIYGLAVGVTVGSAQLTWGHVSWLLVLSYGGGVLCGGLVGLLGWQVLRRLDDPILENIALVTIPFGAFLAAEALEASGVLAVVVAGLLMSQFLPRVTGPATRQKMNGFWILATTVLSSALFVLVGLEAQVEVRSLSSVTPGQAVGYILAIAAIVMAARWAWLYTVPYVIRIVDRRPSQVARRVGARQRTVNGIAGFRGAVSLAAALAVPRELDSGAPFPERDLIIVITCGVIVITLLQALVLPAVVRFARLPEDHSVADEIHSAQVASAEAAYEALDDTAAELGSDERVIERVRHDMDKQLKLLAAGGSTEDPIVQHHDQYRELRLALLARKRETLLQLRDRQEIDDIVLRQLEARLDLEEVRLANAARTS